MGTDLTTFRANDPPGIPERMGAYCERNGLSQPNLWKTELNQSSENGQGHEWSIDGSQLLRRNQTAFRNQGVLLNLFKDYICQ